MILLEILIDPVYVTASDAQSLVSQPSGGDDSSDESEYSVDEHPDKVFRRSSQSRLAALDQVI